MPIPDLSDPLSFLTTLILFFLIICIRYFLFSSLFYLFFHKWYKEKWKIRKVNSRNYSPIQFKKEVKWSILTSLIFALSACVVLLMWQKGFTKIYTGIDDYGWIYLPFSLLILLFLHESYYYWLHRWMHLPGIFRVIHKIHHESNITSPFTAFSFHPIESFLQAIFIPIIILILPLHFSVIIFLVIFMTITSMINHLDIEIYSQKFSRNFLGKWLIGATHHSLHHMEFKFNFGLYFTFWDKIHRTESKKFHPLFDKLSAEESTTTDGS